MTVPMKLILDARYVRVGVGNTEPQRLKYWEHGWMTLRPLRDTPLGEIEVGQAWQCPQWLFDRVYCLATVR